MARRTARTVADNDLRFARLSLAAAEIARGVKGIDWKPDLVHAHDWPPALAPAYLAWEGSKRPSIMTVHNLAHQGLFPAERRAALAIPDEAFGLDGVEFHGQVSFLKAGLFYADHVTTVIPDLCRRRSPPRAIGCGLHGLLSGIAAEGGLTGIVNGIGDDWEPENDPYVGRPFGREDVSGQALDQGARLDQRSALRRPTARCSASSRASSTRRAWTSSPRWRPRSSAAAARSPFSASATRRPEEMLGAVVRNHRDHVAMLNGFNEPMAHRIMAASDFYLMPSRFEPCGLSQLHAQRYGSLPVAHATGGLVDTIEDGETGFLFADFTAESFTGAIERAFETFVDERKLARMRRAAMSRTFDWTGPAIDYVRLYARLTGKPALRVARSTGHGDRAFPPTCAAASCMSIL